MKKIFLSIVFIFLISSCVSFKNPTDSLDNAIFDKNLLGLWELSFNDELYRVLILNESASLYQITIYNENFELQFETSFSGYLTKLNSNIFINISIGDDGYIIYAVDMDENELILKSVDRFFVMDLIDDNILIGDYDKMGATVDSSSKEIREMLTNFAIENIFLKEYEIKARRIN